MLFHVLCYWEGQTPLSIKAFFSGQVLYANAHGDLGRIQELLAQESALINTAWDWGAGDWETALGAAAHVDRRDIGHVSACTWHQAGYLRGGYPQSPYPMLAACVVHTGFPCWLTRRLAVRRRFQW